MTLHGFRIIACHSKEESIRREADMIQRYNPIANAKIPKAPRVSIERFSRLGDFTDPATGEWIRVSERYHGKREKRSLYTL